VLFGSDWPHGEGRDSPRHFDEELSGVTSDDLAKVLHGNTAGLLGIG
jgi:predicted TIM-barrel fold metal-dependent hydrolase